MFDAILQAKYLCLTSKRKTRPPLAYLRINLINHWNLTSSPRSSGKKHLVHVNGKWLDCLGYQRLSFLSSFPRN